MKIKISNALYILILLPWPIDEDSLVDTLKVKSDSIIHWRIRLAILCRARLFNVDIRQIPANGLSRSRIHVSIAAARRSSVHDDL